MNTSRQINSDLWYIGASDRRLALFENMMPIPRGTSYNSYVLMDEKTVLLDTADQAVSAQFIENLTATLAGRPLDYIVIHHVEPDHLASLENVLVRWPKAVIVCSLQASRLMKQFMDISEHIIFQIVKEGETLNTGKHTLHFVGAQMVHWPEVLVSYDDVDKVLFSADAFGTFGALGGNLYADEVNFDCEWMNEARRYYTNIVGKYGMQVQNLLNASGGRISQNSSRNTTNGAATNRKTKKSSSSTVPCTGIPNLWRLFWQACSPTRAVAISKCTTSPPRMYPTWCQSLSAAVTLCSSPRLTTAASILRWRTTCSTSKRTCCRTVSSL